MKNLPDRLLGAWIPGAVFLFAATAKLVWHDQFEETLRWVGLTSSPLRVATLTSLVALEGLLGLLLLIRGPRPFLRLAALGVLILFSFFLMALLAAKDPPACGCFGPLRVFRSHRAEIILGLGRNILLIAGLCWPGWSSTPARLRPA